MDERNDLKRLAAEAAVREYAASRGLDEWAILVLVPRPDGGAAQATVIQPRKPAA